MNALLEDSEEKIEQLRDDLVTLALEKGTFADKNVLALSQQLDECLVSFLKLRLEQKL